ncbi:uncharacterized protein LOC113312635 [Papaver somniferum]|uniref:uncharacterized protein LOC113312635 n=1 Tax=Papaver somniferum TaxID=3469 RepID=UPI000E6FD161|nr:uncharacterized protein LOC113312635 [Papaver somniferum]
MGTYLGNGATTNFLFGFWNPKGILWDWLADECMCSICPDKESRVADFMQDGKIVLPNYSHGIQCECVDLLQRIEYDVRDEDKTIWKGSKTGEFSMKDTFKALFGEVVEVGWTRMVLFKHNIPRHSFISWLARHSRFKTKAKLMRWGIMDSAGCVLCENGIEDEEHLFLNCTFSRDIWQGLLIKMGVCKELSNSWDIELLWCQKNLLGDGAVTTDKKLCLNSFIYHVWMERNNKIFSSKKMVAAGGGLSSDEADNDSNEDGGGGGEDGAGGETMKMCRFFYWFFSE